MELVVNLTIESVKTITVANFSRLGAGKSVVDFPWATIHEADGDSSSSSAPKITSGSPNLFNALYRRMCSFNLENESWFIATADLSFTLSKGYMSEDTSLAVCTLVPHSWQHNLILSDYGLCGTSLYAAPIPTSSLVDGTNTVHLNTFGYVQLFSGVRTSLCIREYDYDVLNIQPPNGTSLNYTISDETLVLTLYAHEVFDTCGKIWVKNSDLYCSAGSSGEVYKIRGIADKCL
jgi:hypothetical protein